MSKWGTSLTPAGTGNTANQIGDFFQSAGNVAQETGMTDQLMGAVQNQMSAGMANDQQLGAIYHLLAAHPNEVAMYFLTYTNDKGQPSLLVGLAQLIDLIMKKNLYEWFNGPAFKGDYVDAAKAAELGYSSITQENIDMVIANMVPLQQLAMDAQQDDARSMQILQSAHFQAMSQEQQAQHQQQQWQQQQQQQQWQQPPQREGFFKSLAKIGAVTGAGALGGAGAQSVATNLLVNNQNQQPYGQQPYGQPYQVPGQPMQQPYMHGQAPPM